MQQKKTKSNSNLFIYGKHPVLCALKNPRRNLKNLYITKNLFQEISHLLNQIKVNVIFRDSHELSMMLIKDANHQNIILETSPLKPIHLEDILNQVSNKETSCLIILDQVTDPHNIGAIIRSAAAFNLDGVILPENNSPKESNTIIKTSAGTFEKLPVAYVTNLVQTIKTLKEEGYWIIGLDGNTETLLEKKIFSQKIAFVMGSEDTGMRKLTRENCDYIAKIDISSNAESLNVSNAAAIAMYEYYRYALLF